MHADAGLSRAPFSPGDCRRWIEKRTNKEEMGSPIKRHRDGKTLVLKQLMECPHGGRERARARSYNPTNWELSNLAT